MALLSRGRRKRLRKDLAPQRRKANTAVRAALAAQQKALKADPDKPPAIDQIERVAATLEDLAKDLRRRAGGDAKVASAAQGVADLAEAYDTMAAAQRADDVDRAAALMRRSIAALDRSDRQKARAGDAWPL